jgi:hypothetical protein
VANEAPIVFQRIGWRCLAVDFDGHALRVITDNAYNLPLDGEGRRNVRITIELHSDGLADTGTLTRLQRETRWVDFTDTSGARRLVGDLDTNRNRERYTFSGAAFMPNFGLWLS